MIDIIKNYFLLFAKCLKMYSFSAFAFKVFKKCYYDPPKKKFFLAKNQDWYQKRRIYADFEFVDAGFKIRLLKSFKQKTRKNVQQRK